MGQTKKQIIQGRKTAVGYRDKAVTCSGCAHFRTTLKPKQWIVKRNKESEEAEARGQFTWGIKQDLTLPHHQTEVAPRCEEGTVVFPVKRSGCCQNWSAKIN